jgi:hypothetical protein
MIRVQIPAWTDAWMRGDRYGVVTRVLARLGQPKAYMVKLDRSGRTLRFLADDCQEIA